MPAHDQRRRFIQSLAERPGPRLYLKAQDPEDGRRYLWEAVEDGGRLVAVKQLEIDVQGVRWRYDWKHLEDENGFLTDQPLNMDTNILETTRSEFFNEWES